jgi:hypothetical protein
LSVSRADCQSRALKLARPRSRSCDGVAEAIAELDAVEAALFGRPAPAAEIVDLHDVVDLGAVDVERERVFAMPAAGSFHGGV